MLFIEFYLLWILADITLHDIFTHRIPNHLLLFLYPFLASYWMCYGFFQGWIPCFFSFSVRFIASWSLLILFRYLRLSGGDCKLIFLFLLLLDLSRSFYFLFFTFFVAFIFALLHRFLPFRKDPAIALAPFINLSFILYFFV